MSIISGTHPLDGLMTTQNDALGLKLSHCTFHIPSVRSIIATIRFVDVFPLPVLRTSETPFWLIGIKISVTHSLRSQIPISDFHNFESTAHDLEFIIRFSKARKQVESWKVLSRPQLYNGKEWYKISTGSYIISYTFSSS